MESEEKSVEGGWGGEDEDGGGEGVEEEMGSQEVG